MESPLSSEQSSLHEGRGVKPVRSNAKSSSVSSSGSQKASSLKWNALPKIGETLHERKHSMNVTFMDSMHVAYDPRYNPKLNVVDTFIQFNEQCPLSDVVTLSSERLYSFAKFLNYYYESRKFMTDKGNKLLPNLSYPGEVDGINFLEIETLIQLWYVQTIRFLHKTQSLTFSSGTTKWLLQRRQRRRNRSHAHPHLPLHLNTHFGSNTAIDPDVLLVRSGKDDKLWGWQVAFDEPNLNVLDFVIDLSMLNQDGKSSDILLRSQERIVVTDVMGRPTEQISSSTIPTATELEDSKFHLNSSDAVSLAEKAQESASISNPKKSKKTSHVGPVGIASLFKKKGGQVPPQQNTHEPEHHFPLGSLSSIPASVESGRIALKSKWLENHLSRRLSNFTRIYSPTIFEMPAPSSDERQSVDGSKLLDYKLQYLRMKLPFQENSIPSILCPGMFCLVRYDKWRTVLTEFFRCLCPGGTLQTEMFDFKGSPADAENKSSDPITIEFKKIMDAAALEAIKKNIQVYPVRNLVALLNKIGFINVKCCVLSFKRGDLVNELGFVYEFLSMYQYDTLVRRFLDDPSKYPEGTNPSTFPLRYYKERAGKIHDDMGALRMVCITADKPFHKS